MDITDDVEFTNALAELVRRSYNVPSEIRARAFLAEAVLLINAETGVNLIDELVGIIRSRRSAIEEARDFQ